MPLFPPSTPALPGQPPGFWPRTIPWVSGKLFAPGIRRLGASWDVQFYGLDHLRAARRSRSFIVCSFHEALLINVHTLRDLNLVGVISPSWEGEIISRFVEGMGIEVVRASSGHYPVRAVRESVRRLRQGRPIDWALDGPIGPRRMIRPGAIQIASISGKPLLPMHGLADRSWYLPTWDRQEIPKPFARLAVGFGEPLFVPPKLRGDDLHREGRRLLAAMRTLERGLGQSLVDGEDD